MLFAVFKSIEAPSKSLIWWERFTTDLESKLREKGVTKVVVAGMMTHMCIDATVRAAVDLGFETTLIEDACATRELSYQGKVVPAEQVHYAFVGALDGMYASIRSTEDFLQQNN
ncbi:isochorismatase family protein [Virgibacillus sp. CBA3643]|uniref:isochorismatase family protein n=1 Tax=Virgibacillus sp. CBA3643 TaxID=2942278 RepID=UPI0035A274BC